MSHWLKLTDAEGEETVIEVAGESWLQAAVPGYPTNHQISAQGVTKVEFLEEDPEAKKK